MNKVAVGVGYYFTIVEEERIRGIKLNKSGVTIRFKDEDYHLYKGETFADSEKVDRILNTEINYPIEKYKI